MTPRQAAVRDFIRERIELTGVSPSFGEIAAAVTNGSKSVAFDLVGKLLDRGALVKTPGRSRNLKLPGADLGSVPTESLRAELDRRIFPDG